jgi:hypothetical protein
VRNWHYIKVYIKMWEIDCIIIIMSSGLYVTLTDHTIRHFRFFIHGKMISMVTLRAPLTPVTLVVKKVRDLFQILHVCSERKRFKVE